MSEKNGCRLCNATKMLNSFSYLPGVAIQFALIWSHFPSVNFCYLNHITAHKKYTTEFLHPVPLIYKHICMTHLQQFFNYFDLSEMVCFCGISLLPPDIVLHVTCTPGTGASKQLLIRHNSLVFFFINKGGGQ